MTFNGSLSPQEHSCRSRESHYMGRGDEVARSGSPCTPGRRERCLRRQPGMWWSWRTVFLAVLGGVAAAAMEATECSYETTLDELGGGSHEVSVDVSHTFDGVPAADQSCPQGYGAVVLDLRTASGNIRALFLDISVNYGLLSTLDDHGPTLVDANRGTTLEGFSVEYNGVDSVAGVVPQENGAFDMGMAIGDDVCSTQEEALSHLAVRVVGCGFTLAHLKFQRISVVTSCVGEDSESDIATLGYGRAVPDGCSAGEVLEYSLGKTSSSTTGGSYASSDSRVDDSRSPSDTVGGSSGSAGRGGVGGGSSASGFTDCKELANVLKLDGRSALVSIWEDEPLLYSTSTEDCAIRTITVSLEAWEGSSVKAAFFDLENKDLDNLELTATLVSPTDGSVDISSEKVDQSELSAIDGFDSGSSGFDMAVAFEGDSSSLTVNLKGCGLTIDAFATNRATLVITYLGSQYNLAEPRLECTIEQVPTPAPTALSTFAPSSNWPGSAGPATASPVVLGVPPSSPVGGPEVSGVDPDAEEEEVFNAAREGLATIFGLDSVQNVAVAASAVLEMNALETAHINEGSYDLNDGDTSCGGGSGIGGGGGGGGAARRRLPSVWREMSSLEAGDDGDGDDEANRLPSEQSREARKYVWKEEALHEGWEAGWELDEALGREEGKGEGDELVEGWEEEVERKASGGASSSDSARGVGGDSRDSDSSSIDGGDDHDRFGYLRSSRGLQSDESGNTASTVDMDFQVVLTTEEGDASDSTSSRVALVVEDYAEGGRKELADALGVLPSEISMSNLAFCLGGNTSCGNATTLSSSGLSVSDELGTSGPWENFLKYGGMLFLALVGTCAVCFCSAAVCYHCLFDGNEFEDADVVKPSAASSVVNEHVATNKLDLTRMSSGRPSQDGDPSPSQASVGAHSDGENFARGLGDAKEGDRVGGEGGEIDLRAVEAEGGVGMDDMGVGMGHRKHWTSAQFRRMHSLEEYQAQNPLAVSDSSANVIPTTKGSARRFVVPQVIFEWPGVEGGR
eukprot:jgi/Undpi1/12536/HiC_scaffold_6.g02205.m1